MALIALGVGTVLGIAALGSFIGSSISHYLFSDETKNTNELKSEIHVMSNEIKGISLMEVIIISLVVFVISSITCIATVFCVLKKCKKDRSDNFSFSQQVPQINAQQQPQIVASNNQNNA